MAGKRIAYIIFLLLVGLFSIFYNVYFTMIFFFAVVLLPFLLLLGAWMSLRNLSVKITADPVITEKNKEAEIRFEAVNESAIPVTRLEICYTYRNEISGAVKKDRLYLSVDKKGSAYSTVSIRSEHCGNIKVTIERIRCYDFLGIFRTSRKLKKWATVSVMPSIHPMAGDLIKKTADMEMEEESNHYLEHKPGNDPSEIFGVREYKEGDRPNQIHWKLSRKNQKLIMKEYSQPLRDRAILYLSFKNSDKGEKKLQSTDCFMEAVMSVSEGILGKGHEHRMVWYDRNINQYMEQEITNPDSSREAQMALLGAAFYETGFPEKEYGQLETGGNVLYITNEIKEEEIIKWHRGGNRLLYVVYINDLEKAPIGTGMEEFLAASLIPCYRIDIRKMEETIFKLGITA